jgi:hypothetical protein
MACLASLPTSPVPAPPFLRVRGSHREAVGHLRQLCDAAAGSSATDVEQAATAVLAKTQVFGDVRCVRVLAGWGGRGAVGGGAGGQNAGAWRARLLNRPAVDSRARRARQRCLLSHAPPGCGCGWRSWDQENMET